MDIFVARYETSDDDTGGLFVKENLYSTEEKARACIEKWLVSEDETFYRDAVDFYVWKRELDTQKQEHVFHTQVQRTYTEYMQLLAKKTGGRVV